MIPNNPRIEPYRVLSGMYRSTPAEGNNGAFIVPGPRGPKLFCIASDQLGWEHVSISPVDKNRCPYWDEMCFIKDLFWLPVECVVQYHPPQARYVNIYSYVLHLWRPTDIQIPMPPLVMV